MASAMRSWLLRAALSCGIGLCLVAAVLTSGEALATERQVHLTPVWSPRGAPADEGAIAASRGTTAYLPLVTRSSTAAFLGDSMIWAHLSEPSPLEVALFRCEFAVDDPLTAPDLVLFADTRYEAWLDGQWVGRGPARFSRATWEYDVYRTEDLEPGEHVLAVSVEWAPNARRAESTMPLLLGHIEGMSSTGTQVLARTGPTWKALLSDAWRRDAAPVHSWDLIGPTELLDLRKLPPNWMLPGGADGTWPSAHVLDGPTVAYAPRSIPLLENVPITPTVLDAGFLSPEYALGELVPPIADPYAYTFDVLNATTFTVVALADSAHALRPRVLLDGHSVAWGNDLGDHPDVHAAAEALQAGQHILSFSGIGAQGETFAVSTDQVESDPLPFGQGTHAGRRLLLADLVASSDAVTVSASTVGLDIAFSPKPAYVVLDLGRVVHGRLRMTVEGAPGTVVDVGWDERLWHGVRPLPYPGSLHREWNQVDSWVLDGEAREIATLDARAGRYILIGVWGEGPVGLWQVQAYEERYPVVQRGAFSSSDPLLNRIWQTGVDTLYPNMVDAYTDTPWRERGQWWGDAYVEEHINRVAFGDSGLYRRGLQFMAEAFTAGRPVAMAPSSGANHMLDYGMLWARGLGDYWRLTGDLQTVASAYPVLHAFMAHLEGYEGSGNLLDIPFGHWSKTALVDWAGYSSRYGQSAALNALYYATLLDAAEMADGMGEPTQAEAWRSKADRVRQGTRDHLYRQGQHRYVASMYEGVPLAPSPHAQAWPLACGLVPEGEADSIAASLLELLSSDPSAPNVETYGMFWVLDGLGRSGQVSQALEVIKGYYGRMLDRGATTWWEGFHSDLAYHASLSHGWSGAPTWFLTTYVLGASRTGPDTWRVRPALEGVTRATGVLPLREGILEVTWDRRDCQGGTLELAAPPDTRGEIVVPSLGATAVVVLNGQVVWAAGEPRAASVWRDGDQVRLAVDGGAHVLSVSQECSTLLSPAEPDR